VFGVYRVKRASEEEIMNLVKIVKDYDNDERKSAPGIDEDKRSALDPCSSSDLERVAGTRLVVAELMISL
jgi:uncharacterized protein (UPF0264 family)